MTDPDHKHPGNLIASDAHCEAPRLLAVSVRVLLILVSVTILASVLLYPWLHGIIVAPVAGTLGTVAAIVAVVTAFLAAMVCRRQVEWLLRLLMSPKRQTFLLVLVLVTSIGRLAVLRTVASLPGQAPTSPNVVHYEKSAFLPPGHLLAMETLHLVLGDSDIVESLFACAIVAAVTLLVFRLGWMAYGERVARLAAVMISVLPSWVFYGMLEYDLLLGLLQVLLLYLFFCRPPQRHTIIWLTLYGLAMGFTCLVKPIALIFPLIVGLLYLSRGVSLAGALKKTAVIVVFMFVAIAPWTIRNYKVMGRFVLISTNGGVVFYTANSPGATGLGRANMVGELAKDFPDEVELNRHCWNEGLRYVRENPGQFLRLAGQRQVFLWGSDCGFLSGILEDRVSPGTLNVLRGMVQAPYLLVVCLLVLGAVLRSGQLVRTTLQAAIVLPITYVWALHMVWETHPQHHLPVLPFIAIVAAALLDHMAASSRPLSLSGGAQNQPASGSHGD